VLHLVPGFSSPGTNMGHEGHIKVLSSQLVRMSILVPGSKIASTNVKMDRGQMRVSLVVIY
jgi:hypothetical protein